MDTVAPSSLCCEKDCRCYDIVTSADLSCGSSSKQGAGPDSRNGGIVSQQDMENLTTSAAANCKAISSTMILFHDFSISSTSLWFYPHKTQVGHAFPFGVFHKSWQ
ncbi:uncharacterized protein [Physcomitrium patens]|uniref:Uncharacterized protein n=2 Tax=Physcomitrium patens TaxID=3218 RepID=A0A7I4FT90_PHYPA|nr:uncharacterized protein LOC112284470 isoform X2 [Physcomitrium patens]|eukprot:XP_024380056.1 uncharacterized protein LOC112284470 isoform X2 [Physcomitrella patens]